LKKFCEQEGITAINYGNFAVVEYYLPPSRNMYIIGTVAENPDEPGNMLMKKGEYVDLLYISDKPGKEIADRLGKRAKNWIIYGGSAAVFSLFGILVERDVVFGSALHGTFLMVIGSLLIFSRNGLKIMTIIGKTVGYLFLTFFGGASILILISTIRTMSKTEGPIQAKLIGLILPLLFVAFMAYFIRGWIRALRSE
jgi:hypothetical protein